GQRWRNGKLLRNGDAGAWRKNACIGQYSPLSGEGGGKRRGGVDQELDFAERTAPPLLFVAAFGLSCDFLCKGGYCKRPPRRLRLFSPFCKGENSRVDSDSFIVPPAKGDGREAAGGRSPCWNCF